MAEIMTKYKLFWDWEFEKEEQWLNEMAESGWALVRVRWCKFIFEQCEPGEYTVRLDMHAYDKDYISFMKETGAEHVGRCFSWQYFRKKSELGQFDLFSDIDSRLSHISGLHKMLKIVGLLNMVIGIVSLFLEAFMDLEPFTPGNFFVAILNLLVATVTMYGVGRLKGKMEYLENERKLIE